MNIVNFLVKYLFTSTLLGILMGHWLSKAASDQTSEPQVATPPAPGKIIQFPQREKLRKRG